MLGCRGSTLLASAVCTTALLGAPLATSAGAAVVSRSQTSAPAAQPPAAEALTPNTTPRSCTYFNIDCSRTTNETDHEVGVAKEWCGKGGYHGPCSNTDYLVLRKNQSTPTYQDWDGLFVAAGCTYKGIKHAVGGGFTINGGTDGKWVHVHGDEHYYIKSITC